MKTFISQETDAIIIDDEFANLTNYSRRRSRYTYQFSVRVDQLRALALRSTKLRITVKKIENAKKTSMFSGQEALTPDEAIDAILIDKPRSKDKIRSKRRSIIARRRMDITGRMNNEVARYLDRFTEEEAETLLPKIRTYEFKKVSQLILERSETSYNNNVFLEDGLDGDESADEQKASLYAINQMNVDPAKLIMSRQRIRSQDDALMGTIPSPETVERGKNAKTIADLRSGITTINNRQELSEMDPNDLVPVIVKKPRRYFTVRKSIRIHRRHLRKSRRFQVVVELLDREGAIVQRETQIVNHSRLARDYYIPRRAPTIKYVGCELGENVIEIQQRDKKCDSVLLLRRSITDSDALSRSEYDIVGKFSLRKRGRRSRTGREWKRIVDRTPNTNPVIYRVLPVRGRRIGTAFRSIVAPPCNLPGQRKTTKNKFSTMFLKSIEEGISIEVRNFDKEADFMSIYRRDLTAKEKNFKRLLDKDLEGNEGAFRKIGGPLMQFIDLTPKSGRTYEYYAELLYADGNSFRVSGSQFIEHLSPDDEVSFEVEEVRIRSARTQPNVTMKIITKSENANGKTNLTEKFRNFTSRNGIKDLYRDPDQLEELRDDGKNLIGFLIERHNLTTGEREQFNIFEPDEHNLFDDYREGRTSRVKPLEIGHEYRYVVTACSVHPSALLKNAALMKTDSRTRRKYRTNFAKSRSRYTRRRGSLLPRRSKIRNTGKNTIFNSGKTGSIKVVEADFTDSFPSMRGADVEKISHVENKITWAIQGDPARIDHFIISVELRNCSIPILTSAALPGKTRYEIIDRFTPRIRGPVEFKITPVFVDFKRGESINAGALISSGLAGKRRRQGRAR